jgi:hypothetical protein
MNRKMNRKSFPTILVGLILCAAFCLPVAAQQESPTPRVSPTPTPIEPSSRSQRKLPFAIRDNSPLSSVNVANYQQVAAEYESERTIASRNRLIFMAVSQIDLHFRSNERKVRHRNRLFQTVLDILEVGAATAISITNGERAKSVIADGLGFIQGSRESIDKNYRMLDRQILVNKMVEKRAKVLTTIYERVGKSDEEYPFERAFIDLLDYFEAGRIDSALTELAKDSGSTAVNAETALDLAKAKADANIRLASSSATIRLAQENEQIVQAIADSEFAAGKTITEANEKITTANAVINSNAPEPDKESARQLKEKAQEDIGEAKKVQAATMAKYKKIVKAIDENPKLYVILDKLPSLYNPQNAEVIEKRVAKVRAGTATPEEYGLVLLRFYERIAELVGTDAESAAQATQILKEANKEEQNDGN